MSASKGTAVVDIIINNEVQRKKIQEMTDDFEALRRKRVEALKAGNGELAKSIQKEMNVIRKELRDTQKQTIDVDHVLRNLNKVPLNQLRQASQQLRKDIQGMERDSVQYLETQLKIEKVEREIASSRAQQSSGGSKGWLAAGAAAGLALLNRYGGRAVDVYTQLDDKMADVQKTTGLTMDQVKKLDASLMKLDTRTSREGLLDTARIGGKLGLTNLEDIEGFVRAADQISVALSEDLGGDVEETIRQLGKLVDIFGLEPELGLDKALLSIGSAINSLGADSTANEQYLVDFANRTAGIAPKAKISIQNILGLAAATDNLGQTAEVAGTTYSQVITGMFDKTDKYARVAGMSVKEFSNLLKTDANEAFLRFLEGVNATGDMEGAVKRLGDLGLNGARATQVLGALAGNVDMIRERQALANEEFASGNSILEEYNTKNSSAQATVEKNKKVIQEQVAVIGEQLFPLWSEGLGFAGKSLKVLVEIIKYGIKYRGVLISLTSAVVLYNTVKKIQKIRSDESRAALLLEITTLNKATASTKLLTAAKLLLTGNLKAATQAFKLFFAAIGPVGWAVLALGALGSAVSILATSTNKAEKEQRKLAATLEKEVSQAVADETGKLELLKRQLKDTEPGSTKRLEIIKELKENYPGLLDGIDAEKISIEKLSAAIDKYVIKSKDRIRLQVLEKTYLESNIKLEQAKIDLDNGQISSRKYNQIYLQLTKQNTALEQQMEYQRNLVQYGERYAELQKEKAALEKNAIPEDIANQLSTTPREKDEYEAWAKRMKETAQATGTFFEVVSYDQYLKNFYDSIDEYAKQAKRLEQINKEIENIENIEKSKPDIDKRENTIPPAGDFEGGKWSLEKDEKFMRARIELRKKQLAGELATEEEFNNALLALEIEALERRLKAGVETGENRLKLEADLADKRYQQTKNERTRLDKLLVTSLEGGGKTDTKQLYDKEKLDYEKRLKELGLFNKKREDMTEQELNALQNLERNHILKLQNIYTDNLVREAKEQQDEIIRKLNAIKLAHTEEFQQADTFAQKKALILKYYGEAEARRVKTEKQADSSLKKFYQAEEQKQLQEHLESLKDKYVKMMAELRAINDQGVSIGDLNPEEVARIQELIDKLNEQLAGLRTSAPGQVSELNAKVDILGYTAEDWENFFTNLQNGELGLGGWQMALNAIGSTFSQISDLMSAVENRQFKEFEKIQQRRKKRLESNLKSNRISQDEYNEQVQKLDEETDKKREELQKKQAIREKALAVFQAMVNTALAVATALSTKPTPLGIALAATVGAMGAAQIATIIATPLPGAEDGGRIGVTREQDGEYFDADYDPDKRGRINKPTVLVAENGPEYVIPNEGYDNPTIRPVLDVIETARRNGTLGTINLPAVLSTTMGGRSLGGYVTQDNISVANTDRNTPINYSFPPEFLEFLRENLEMCRTLHSEIKDGAFSIAGKNGFLAKFHKYFKMIDNSRG